MMLSDLIAVMEKGKVVQLGSPDEIYRRPANRYVATFVGKPQMNIFDVTGEHGEGEVRVTAPGLAFGWNAADAGISRQLRGDAVAAGIRPEDVRIVTEGDAGETVTGNVTLVEPLGPDSYVEIAFGPNTLTARVEPDRTPGLGATVTVQLPAAKLHFFDGDGQRIN